MPVWIELTSAAQHDLPPLKAILSNLWHCRLFGNKAYCSLEVAEQLAKQGSAIFCPEKNKKGEAA